ncbi:hypothetical protein AB833_06415 [Chromatiales bacterium (ex Bugula neritina AB1)]|nr:hypothetical protein AB833_06415 [Chromatiales bacterium (ex Bugula neritina AB1)]
MTLTAQYPTAPSPAHEASDSWSGDLPRQEEAIDVVEAAINTDGTDTDQQQTRVLRSSMLKNWNSSNADVQLNPISCVEVYRELVTRGNPVHLLPQAPDSSGDASSKALNSARYLQTRHDDRTLSQQCRKLQMETSPDNPAIRYSLYIAAGFAVTIDRQGQKKRIPLLLIPVTIDRSRGRGSPYTVSYTQGSLRLNPHIAESCDSHVEQIIEPFDTAADMRDFLRALSRKLHATLQCRISANTGLFTLQSDVLTDISPDERLDLELARTRPGTEFQPMPPAPDQFNAQLAIRMLRFIDGDQLSAALQSFAGTKEQGLSSESLLARDPDLHGENLEKSLKCAQWLTEIGLGYWRLQHIYKLPERVRRMAADIENLCEQSEFKRHFNSSEQTVGLLVNLYKSHSRINNAPPEMQHHAISMHADPDTRLLLQKAKIQAASIEHQMETARELFHLSAVPNSRSLARLIKIIAKREQESQLTNPAYFRARRQLNEILKTHNGLVTDKDLESLTELSKTLKFSELFENDVYYKRCFGNLFRGVNSNWQRLDSVVNFARNLSYELDSSHLVSRLIEHWPSFQRDFNSLTPALRPAATSAHKLTTLIPMFVSSETNLANTVKTAVKFHDKVNQWQRYLQKNVTDVSLTPYAMLEKSAAAMSMQSPVVSLSQQEYDDRIYHHIVGKGLSRETVAATAEWLRVSIERLEIDIPTIRRYLDSESSFDSPARIKSL